MIAAITLSVLLGGVGAQAAEVSSGSGVVIGATGEILTNAHVVEGCQNITVKLASGNTEPGVLVASDERNDLALVRIRDIRNPLPSVAMFRDSVPVRPGDAVVALGYPLSGLLSSDANVSVGNVSALAGLRDDSRYLQISAPVQPGNSGGPLLDASGHLVGIVTAKLDAMRLARFTGDIPQNVNFALKAEVARTFLDSKGIAYQTARSDRQLSPADVGAIARPFTAHIECEQVASRSATNVPISNPPGANDGGLTQQQIDWCRNKSPHLRIKGCTAVIQWRLHGGELPDRVELMALQFRGMAYLDKHDYNQAIADLSEAIRLSPEKEANMFYFRGKAYSLTGDDNRAIADYSEAIRLNPKDVLAFYWRGESHLNRHDYGSAFSDLSVVAQSSHAPLKMAALAATTIGQMYAGDGFTRDYGRAMHWFRIAADKGNTIAMKEIGMLYAMGFGIPRDCDLAERWLEKAAIAGNEALEERAERIIRNCRILSR